MKRWSALGLLVLVALAAPACNRSSSQAVGRLTVDGKAEVATEDGALKTVTDSRTLKSGEQVKMIDGTGILSLGGGRRLELRKDTVLRLALQPGPAGQTEPRGELVSGDVLVTAAEDTATVVAGDSTVQVTGAARVSRGLSAVVAVYQGAAGVETAGRAVSVPALRQVTVPAPGLPSRPTPLAFTAADLWDQRFLGDAIDLGNQLVSRSRGFSAQLPPDQGNSVGFFQQILPKLATQPGFDASLLDPARAPGETLVGAAVSLEGTKGSFGERWTSVFSFHEDGAPWGLVALDQGVSRGPLLSTVDAAIGRASGLGTQAAPAPQPPTGGTSAAPPVVPVPVPSVGGQVAAPGNTSDDAAGGEAALPGGTTGTGTTGGSGPVGPTSGSDSPEGPLNLGVPLVDDPVNSVADAVGGLLRAIGRE